MGFDRVALNQVLIRLAEHFISLGDRVLFGHDWRADGVMDAIGAYAQSAVSEGSLMNDPKGERLLNLVPSGGKPLSVAAEEAERYGGGVLAVRTLQDAVENEDPERNLVDLGFKLPAGWQEDRVVELWVLRTCLTRLLAPGCRICLGGRVDDYDGFYAGILEEAYFALAQGKPLYLLPAFGGSTRVVWEALKGNLASPLLQRQGERPRPGTLQSKVVRRIGLPMGGLGKALSAVGVAGYRRANGLELGECEQLERTTDIEVALSIVTRRAHQVASPSG